jgi:glycosyltransferase involved in cell wall biosynthesis
MRIAIITPVFPPYRGGIGTIARDHAEMLAHAGHDVTVITPRRRHLADTPGVILKPCRPLLTYGNAALLPQLFFALDDFDVVHLHYPFLGAAEWVLLWKMLAPRRTRLVVTYHMDLVGTGWLSRIFRAYTDRVLPALIERAETVTVTSRDYARSSLLGKLPARIRKKIVVLPPSVDMLRFAPNATDDLLSKRVPLHPSDRIVLFVGGLDRAHYFKGVEVLLRAFLQMRSQPKTPRATLVIVGDGNLRPDYERLASALGIRDRVIFLGRILDEELPAAYRLADVVVLPSVDRSEAFGITLLEAAASGRPIVASNLPGVRTLIHGGKNGMLVPPGDPAALAEAISRLLTKRAAAARMGKASRVLARAYAADRVAARLVRLYRAL